MNTNACCTPSVRREGAELHPLNQLWDDLFPFGGRLAAVLDTPETQRALRPALNVAETGHVFTLTAELPGVAKEDVTITIEDGVLTLAGEKKREEEQKDRSWHRVERAYGAFERTLTLPKGVDGDKAEAAFKDGVLTITLPKSDQVKPRTLKIS
jgi:HSP20 family protein